MYSKKVISKKKTTNGNSSSSSWALALLQREQQQMAKKQIVKTRAPPPPIPVPPPVPVPNQRTSRSKANSLSTGSNSNFSNQSQNQSINNDEKTKPLSLYIPSSPCKNNSFYLNPSIITTSNNCDNSLESMPSTETWRSEPFDDLLEEQEVGIMFHQTSKELDNNRNNDGGKNKNASQSIKGHSSEFSIKKFPRKVEPPLPPPEFHKMSNSATKSSKNKNKDHDDKKFSVDSNHSQSQDSGHGQSGSYGHLSGSTNNTFGGSVGCRSSLKSGSVISIQGFSKVYCPTSTDQNPKSHGANRDQQKQQQQQSNKSKGFKFNMNGNVNVNGNFGNNTEYNTVTTSIMENNPEYERIPEQDHIEIQVSSSKSLLERNLRISPPARQKHQKNPNLNNKDSDGDSLLSSFDSNIFQPLRASTTRMTSSESGSSTTTDNTTQSSNTPSPTTSNRSSNSTSNSDDNKVVMKKAKCLPPPLPPKNKNKSAHNHIQHHHNQVQDHDGNNMSKPVVSQSTCSGNNSTRNKKISVQFCGHLNDDNSSASNSSTGSPKSGVEKKRVVVVDDVKSLNIRSTDLPAAVVEVPIHVPVYPGCDYDLDDGYNGLPANISSLFNCGHNNDSRYSTLSSVDENENSPNGNVRNSRALQQLRDLSILIGGSFCQEENKIKEITSLDDLVHANRRKCSNTTDTTGDSGKGNDSSPISGSGSGHSNPLDKCIFAPESCLECLNEKKYTNTGRPISSTTTKGKILKLRSEKTKMSRLNGLQSSACQTPAGPDFCPECQNDYLQSILQDLGGHKKDRGDKVKGSNRIIKRKFPKQGKNITTGAQSSSSFFGGGPIFNGQNQLLSIRKDSNLFTIAEESEMSQIYAPQKQQQVQKNSNGHHHHGPNGGLVMRECQNQNVDHWHPKSWLSRDPTIGWSDLESLYAHSMDRSDFKNGAENECWACWRESNEQRFINQSNTTVDRTKRMFIWLNKRQRSTQKEFTAPWWEAKKKASISWLYTKALSTVQKNSLLEDPFKTPTQQDNFGFGGVILKDEIIRGLCTGKLYFMALDGLYDHDYDPNHRYTSHWDIIKILSRKGLYVAKPTDMKLTDRTLRQRKPLRIAAHIALIEKIMGLYAKEILPKERVLATLESFGQFCSSDLSTHEELLIAWINASVFTLKSYLVSSRYNMSSELLNRWVKIQKYSEIRDLCDGIGICSLFALYCSNDLKINQIQVPAEGECLPIYETIQNHNLIKTLCDSLFPEKIYHLTSGDFLHINGHMKQNIISLLCDLYIHLEVNPVFRVNRLTHIPLHVDL